MAHHADAEVAECVRCPMMHRRYLAGIFVKVLSVASGEMTDRGKGKTFRAAGGHSSNLLFDDGMNELDFQSALHVLVHAHMGIGDAYGSLSVNGFMTDYSYYNQELGDRQSAVIGIKLWESSLADNQISPVSDIQEMEFGLEIKADNTTIDKPTLALMLEKSEWEGPALKMPTSMEQHQAKELKKSMQQAYPFLTGPPKDLAETRIR